MSFIIGIVLRLARFTGLWITIVLIIGIDVAANFILESQGIPHMTITNYPNFQPIYEWILLIVSLIPAVYITIQNLIRLFTQRADFSMLAVIVGYKKNQTEKKA